VNIENTRKTIIYPTRGILLIATALFALSACAPSPQDAPAQPNDRADVTIVSGLSGPEAVRYDPELDVFFVSNFNDEPAGDANGFVSKVSADGEILSLHFMQGSERWPLHGGRGMYIDTRGLWVVDAGGVHLFDRSNGAQLDFVDFSQFELGFLNDIVLAGDGALYVTDTGTSSVYRIADGAPTLATKTTMNPNGITVNPKNGRLMLAPWNGPLEIVEWDIEDKSFTTVGKLDGGGNYDGVEVVQGHIIIASQEDTSLHIMVDGVDKRRIELPGRPADIGIDTKRNRIAVPYVSLHRVDIFSLDGRLGK